MHHVSPRLVNLLQVSGTWRRTQGQPELSILPILVRCGTDAGVSRGESSNRRRLFRRLCGDTRQNPALNENTIFLPTPAPKKPCVTTRALLLKSISKLKSTRKWRGWVAHTGWALCRRLVISPVGLHNKRGSDKHRHTLCLH